MDEKEMRNIMVTIVSLACDELTDPELAALNMVAQLPVMDSLLWTDKSLPVHRHLARAANQLGTSGGGNHFADLVRGKVTKEVD